MADLTRPIFITAPGDLRAMLHSIRKQPRIAIDTESNSLYAYREQVCLVQLSTLNADYLLDPLSPGLDLKALGALLTDPAIEKVLHASEYDVICLRRDFGFRFSNLFDTMWAARILGWPRVGLADILKERFRVTLNKRWQRFNWGKRPLPREAQAYAQLDTHYLLRLRDIQFDELRARGRLDEAREVFAELTQSEGNARDESDVANGLWRIKGVHDLEPAARAVLRELVVYRENEARRLDRPPFKVFSDATLVALAAARPRQIDHLRRIPGMSAGQIARHGHHLLRAVSQGRHSPPPQAPPRKSIDPAIVERYERLREWRKRVAAQRGVESDVIISNAALMALARRKPRSPADLEAIDGFGPWRRKTYGQAILDALRD